MEAMNCPRCGRVFVRIREAVCEACVKQEEDNFEKVREFVKEHPHKTIKEVAEECEVPMKRILGYIRDGRLEASGGMHGEITCSKCGKPIFAGRMCETCILDTSFQISDMKEASRIKNKGRVFTSR